MNRTYKTTLLILFILLYTAVAVVSTFHAVAFFSISNALAMAITLAVAFEIGQAIVLFTLLTTKIKSTLSYVLMCVLTAVQVMGNIFSSYRYAALHSQDEIRYFTDSVLFFVKSPDTAMNEVMISYITGAILPIVALFITNMIVSILQDGPKPVEEPVVEEPEPESTGPETPPEASPVVYD